MGKENINNGAKLGLTALVAVVFGMMVGSGLYNIPQNLAAGAAPLGVIISWVIIAAGMLLLVATFKILSDRRPDLDAGIYQYAQVGFGNFAGFNIAWGYWLCTAFSNVAYAVMLNDSFGAFFPVFLRHGWPTLLLGSGLIWLMFFIVARGIRTVGFLNNLLAFLKIAAILLIIVLLILNLKVGTFELNFSSGAEASMGTDPQINARNAMVFHRHRGGRDALGSCPPSLRCRKGGSLRLPRGMADIRPRLDALFRGDDQSPSLRT